MHTSRPLLAALSGAFVSLVLASSAFAQGALTPPGAPAPSMKTLDQIEPRTPLGTPGVVTTSTIVIGQPGSYVLVGPVSVASGDGITINADNVTLDLNGFTISSTANPRAGSGVASTGVGVSVKNGIIAGSSSSVLPNPPAPDATGFENGVVLSPFVVNSGFPSLSSFSQGRLVNVTAGAFPGVGLVAAKVENCRVRAATIVGVLGGVVESTLVEYFNGYGIVGDTVRACSLSGGFTSGKAAIKASICDTSHVIVHGGNGIDAELATNCYINAGGGAGSMVLLKATIAIGCVTKFAPPPYGGGQSNQIVSKYNMP